MDALIRATRTVPVWFAMLLSSQLMAGKAPDLGPALMFANPGDDVHVVHFEFIGRYLDDHPGSKDDTKRTANEQAATEKSKDLKPPSASIVESEFSHLLGMIRESKKLLGIQIFDRHGLMVGSTG